MNEDLVLSLFPGIDLLGRAFEEQGFCVVRGPDLVWGGDIKQFHPPPSRFGGIIGGPPCQPFSRLRHLVEHNGYRIAANLIPEFERCVDEAQPDWFLMENVRDSPLPAVAGYKVWSCLFNNRWVGAVQNRLRRFSFGTRDGRALHPEVVAFEAQEWHPAVLASAVRPTPVQLGGNGKRKSTAARNIGFKTSTYLRRAILDQGLPCSFLADTPFTVAGKIELIGNGVPMPLGRAIAKAVRTAL